MNSRTALFVVTSALLGAGAVAVIRPSNPESREPSAATASPLPSASTTTTGFDEPFGEMLPPNHPAIGAPAPGAASASEEPPAIAWTVPTGWLIAPNTSTMRIATYHVPAPTRGSDAADVSVVRAGGTADANIQRWIDQFDDAGQDTRTAKIVRGLKITIVEVAGTFTGGSMMPGAQPTPRRGWALLGAIVETPGSPYFFKMTGDAKTVHAARASFNALLESITPST